MAKAKTEPAIEATAVRSPLEEAAERETLRGAQIGRLAEEAKMWRAFATGCKPGRSIYENIMVSLYRDNQPSLTVLMDKITAPTWRAFAENMANTAEQRLREILG